MKMMRFISAVGLACCLSGLTVQAQVQKQSQIDPNLLTKRPALTPELTLQIFDLPDIAITHLSGPTAGPGEAGDMELVIDLHNFGESPFSLKFLNADGQIQPTLEVVHIAPGQSLLGYLNGTDAEDRPTIVKRVFLDAVLEPQRKLSHTQAGLDQDANLISVSLSKLRNRGDFTTGRHSLVVFLDPAETVIERSRRNNMAAFSWHEDFEPVSASEPQERLRLTVPTKKPAKQKAPELRPFQ